MNALKYGPVGDPASADPFEWAQARMPEGWHVEGQVVPSGPWAGWYAEAGTAGRREAVGAIGYTPGLALANLVRHVHNEQRRAWAGFPTEQEWLDFQVRFAERQRAYDIEQGALPGVER